MKIRYAFLVVFLLVTVNLFALKVTYDYDRAFDFSTVKTYQWIELKDSKVNSLTDAKIKQAINEELAKKGFTRVGSDPNLCVAYQVGLQKEEQINTMTTGGWGWSPWYGGGMGTMTATTSTINIGTLVIDVVNPTDKKLVYRSQGTDILNPSSDPDKNYKKIQKAVEKILQNFPPRPKKQSREPNKGDSMLSLLWTAIIGLLIGAVAKLLMPGKDPGDLLSRCSSVWPAL